MLVHQRVIPILVPPPLQPNDNDITNHGQSALSVKTAAFFWQRQEEMQVASFKSYVIKFIWLVVSTPLKNIKVSWDDDIPNIWKVINFMFQTTNQSCYREGNNSKNSEHWSLILTRNDPQDFLRKWPPFRSSGGQWPARTKKDKAKRRAMLRLGMTPWPLAEEAPGCHRVTGIFMGIYWLIMVNNGWPNNG